MSLCLDQSIDLCLILQAQNKLRLTYGTMSSCCFMNTKLAVQFTKFFLCYSLFVKDVELYITLVYNENDYKLHVSRSTKWREGNLYLSVTVTEWMTDQK